MKETDLYEPVKKLLEDIGYEVYAEVQPYQGGKRADVVGIMGPAVCVVEMKTSLSMELIEQAYLWTNRAHYVFIAVPMRRKGLPHFVHFILKKLNIGLIEVGGYWSANVTVKPRFNRIDRKRNINWHSIVRPEHQT